MLFFNAFASNLTELSFFFNFLFQNKEIEKIRKSYKSSCFPKYFLFLIIYFYETWHTYSPSNFEIRIKEIYKIS